MNPYEHIKKTAKRIKKKNSHIKLMTIQLDLARYLGFKDWNVLAASTDDELQKRIDKKPLEGL